MFEVGIMGTGSVEHEDDIVSAYNRLRQQLFVGSEHSTPSRSEREDLQYVYACTTHSNLLAAVTVAREELGSA